MFSERIKKKYDKRILAEREFPEISIMSCILNDLTLLDDYIFADSDFLSIEIAILYKISKIAKKEGYLTLNQFEIKGRLSETERKYFVENEIWLMLSDYEEIANKDNFTDYVDKLYKNNIFMRLTDWGFDIFKEVEFEGHSFIPFNFFKDKSSQDIKEFFEYQINNFSTMEVNKGIVETIIDFSDEYMTKVENGESIGTLFDVGGKDINNNEIVAFPTISTESNGLLDGTLTMLAGYSNVGKSTFLISMIQALVYRGEKVIICSNEQKEKPFVDNFLMWILVNKIGYRGLNKNKLRVGKMAFTEEDYQMLAKAREIWDREYKGKIMFVAIPSAKMDFVQKKFREYHLKHGCTTFVYDTFKVDFSSKNENFWLSLINDSRILSEFANRYNVKVFATMQNALHTQGQLFLDANVLSNSKQVKEVLQNLYLIRDMYQEEKDETSKFYCEPYTVSSEYNDFGSIVHEKKPYILDPNKSYKVIFLDKLREGRTSQQGNYAVVVEFEGVFGTMKEVCLCTPKRMNINAGQRGSSSKR